MVLRSWNPVSPLLEIAPAVHSTNRGFAAAYAPGYWGGYGWIRALGRNRQCDGNKYRTPRRAPCHGTNIIRAESALTRKIKAIAPSKTPRNSVRCLRLSKNSCSASSCLTEWKATLLAFIHGLASRIKPELCPPAQKYSPLCLNLKIFELSPEKQQPRLQGPRGSSMHRPN